MTAGTAVRVIWSAVLFNQDLLTNQISLPNLTVPCYN